MTVVEGGAEVAIEEVLAVAAEEEGAITTTITVEGGENADFTFLKPF
ncbi:MAG: hypothetical protein IPH31_13195 [Lewinellaceae bacterium]|nr:hypothetical protein [Lewinellaceae bacterium]